MAARIKQRLYCCATDVVTRKLPGQKNIRYPQVRKKLLALKAADQRERMGDTFYSYDRKVIEQIAQRETSRAEELLHLLSIIKTPSANNVGLDGSRAIWLIALHNSGYRGIGRAVLQKMKRLYYRDKTQVFYPGIPYLVDMVMLEMKKFDHSAKQLYGTRHWTVRDAAGNMQSGSFRVINPGGLASRRRKFNLVGVQKRCEHYQ